MSDWTARVVEHLTESKAAGLSFERAWSAALEAHPPFSRDLGASTPSLMDDQPLVDFVREHAADAWHGRRPVLRHLRSALEESRVERHPTMRRRVA